MNKAIAQIAVSAATFFIDRPYSYLIPQELAEQIVPGVRVTVPFARGNKLCEGIVLAISETADFEKLKCITGVLDKSPVLSPELIRLALWMHERFFCTVYEAARAQLPAGLWYNLNSSCGISPGIDRETAYAVVERAEKQRMILDVIYAHGGVCDYRDIELAFGESDPGAALRGLYTKGIVTADVVGTRRVKDKTMSFAVLAIPVEEALSLAASKIRSAPVQASVLRLLADFGGASMNDIRYISGASSTSVKKLASEGLITLEELEVFRRPDYKTGEKREVPELNEQQQVAFDGLLSLIKGGKPSASLLHGVTGSGKTSVYVRLISELLKQGRGSIMLVPEIALTPQMLETFSSYFGDEIAVMHSSLSVGERYDEWKRIKTGIAKVVIGTRSAVFAPVENLGLIIIDEEQEDTYKSENSPRYHARDVAKFRCVSSDASLILGSATPNIETSYNAQIGKYKFFSLPARFNQMDMPNVQIVDMKRELRAGNGGDLSSVLIRELSENIQNGQQSILFLNRRGMNKLVSCCECGYVYTCPRCSVNLTYHSTNKRLMCHYCGYSQPLDSSCPDCGGTLNFIGSGTQKIQEELSEYFPDTEILRMDTDTVSGAGSHEVLFSRFVDEKIPIMVGTQMVTKGLDFPNVTLVGVISADQPLYSGDYRASERSFSLITQVVGRSGRGSVAGRAVIQTFTPENQTILQAASQDYDGFYKSELEMRRLQWAPPFSTLYSLTATGLDETQVLRCLNELRKILAKQLGTRADARVLGPAPLSVTRVNNRYRYRLTISCGEDREIRELISSLLIWSGKNKEFKGVSVFGDINPNQ